MKKVLSFVAVLMIVAFSTTAFAASWSAILPHWLTGFRSPDYASQVTYTTISNITNANTTVKVKYYGKVNAGASPSIITDPDNDATTGRLVAQNAYDYSEVTPGYSATFTIKAYESVRLIISGVAVAEPINFGYGIIEWSQDSDVAKGLVAHSYRQWRQSSADDYSLFATPINGGLPF